MDDHGLAVRCQVDVHLQIGRSLLAREPEGFDRVLGARAQAPRWPNSLGEGPEKKPLFDDILIRSSF